MEENNNTFLIDVEKVFAQKTKKRIPKFIINLVKKIIHQDDINNVLSLGKEYQGVEFVNKALELYGVTYTPHNRYTFDSSRKYVFVSNHPLGGLDGLIYISYIGSLFGNVKTFTNDLLMNVKPLQSLFVPVDKYGKMGHSYAYAFNETFASDAPIVYFPAGLCSRLIKGKVTDLEWKKAFVTKAIEHDRDIVPIYFEGRNSMRFYRVAKLRKLLKIKFNIETFLLPSEMFKQKKRNFEFYIREPITIETLKAGGSPKQWTEIIRNKVYGTDNSAC